VEKVQRGNLPKVHGKDRPFADIRMPVSSGDRGVNLSNEEFFDVVTCLEAGLAQFSNALGQRD
jgi:hypothetical protein